MPATASTVGTIIGYWQRLPYLGIGAGAHSFLDDGWGSRWDIAADLPGYRQALQTGTEPMTCLETFDRESALRETIYLALRTRRGVADDELRQRFGCTLADRFPEAIEACGQSLENARRPLVSGPVRLAPFRPPGPEFSLKSKL